jgi:hypothetical protein
MSGDVESVSEVTSRLRIRAEADEFLRSVDVPKRAGDVQRGEAVNRPGFRVGAMREKEGYGSDVVDFRRSVQRAEALLVSSLHVGAGIYEDS